MRETKAFTLIELLIVVAIIAILAAIAVPNFLEAQIRAKVSRARNDLRALDQAAKQNLVDRGNGAYLVDWWDDDTDWGKRRIEDVFGGVGRWPQDVELRRKVDILAPLTTPIAYISSLPWDPLLSTQWWGARGGSLVGTKGDESYSYMDDDPEDTRNPNAEGERGWNLYCEGGRYIPGLHVPRLKFGEWWFIGYGPDRPPIRAETGHRNQDAIAYDPTNGTISNGIIFRRSGGEPY